MTIPRLLGAAVRPAALALALTLVAGPPLAAQTSAGGSKGGRAGGALLPGANSREPVSIDAGKLDYFDKESKLVYTGEVVAKQGESTLRAAMLTIFLSKDAKKGEKDAPTGEVAAAAAAASVPAAASPAPLSPASGSSIRRMEAKGPVTIVSKDEVGTGDNGSYDKGDNKITLTGNVTLTQGTNIIKGDKLVYDMTSGQAQVSGGATRGRVSSVFTPGSGGPPGLGEAPGARKSKVAPHKPAASDR